MPWHCDVDLTRRTGRQFEPVTQCGGCAALLIVDALFPKQLVASECADVASIEGRSAKARGRRDRKHSARAVDPYARAIELDVAHTRGAARVVQELPGRIHLIGL